jgi:hypothetical protein
MPGLGSFLMRRCLLLLTLLISTATLAADVDFLPKSFAGWTQSSVSADTRDAALADSAYPAVLKEYGFTDAETATYTRPDGRKLSIKAARFQDATGAYGAYTFYRQPEMKSEQIGTKAASANQRILFFRSNVLVDANFDRLTGMSAAELRELAAALPTASGAKDNLPSLPQYLPRQNEVENSARYILGSQALAALKAPLTAEQVDFQYDPEILQQQYTTEDGPLTLMLVQYPTPQIAGDRLRALESLAKANAGLAIRRSGPLLIVESGAVNSSEAKAVLNSVNYEAEVTWNEATSVTKRDNIGNLIVAVFGLIGILLLVSLIFGLFFGGFRVVMKRLFPDRVFDRPESVEIIQLHLEEGQASNK